MSDHSIQFHKDLISSYWVILLTDKQTDTGENTTYLAEVTTKTVKMTYKNTEKES